MTTKQEKKCTLNGFRCSRVRVYQLLATKGSNPLLLAKSMKNFLRFSILFHSSIRDYKYTEHNLLKNKRGEEADKKGGYLDCLQTLKI